MNIPVFSQGHKPVKIINILSRNLLEISMNKDKIISNLVKLNFPKLLLIYFFLKLKN